MSTMKVLPKLKQIREENGYSRKVFAELCDIGEKTIQRAENGDNIKYELIEIMAKKLEIDINELVINQVFTEQQLKIINSEASVIQVIAGPGSGKTRTLVERIITLLKKGVNPASIVLFTFTEKAALELNHRVKLKIHENGLKIEGISKMYIGTIHGFCLFLLQQALNMYNDYEVLSPIRSTLFAQRYYYELGINKIKKLNKNEIMKRYDIQLFLNMVNILGENKVENGLVPQEINESLKKYNEKLDEYRYFDFTAILRRVYQKLLEDEELRNYIKENVEYLMVDEYQDVNYIQEEIIKLIYEMNTKICVVGDMDQNIYTWRGSDIGNFIEFSKRYKNVETYYLDINFRSSEGVVDIANKCIKNNLKRDSMLKITASKSNYEVGDCIYNEFEDSDLESEFIADRIKDIYEKINVPLNQIAILVRANKLIEPIINELERRNIPYNVEGVNKLFNTEEVKACIKIIKFLCNQIEVGELQEAWIGVHNKIRLENIKNAIKHIEKINIGESKLFSSAIIQNIYLEFISKLELFELEKENKGIEKILYNLGKFSQVINDYESINYKTKPEKRFKNFIYFIEKGAENKYPEGYLENSYTKIKGVRIMTIHQAKGLEFSAVFVPGLSNNMLPHQKIGGLNEWHFLPRECVYKSERYIEKDIEAERRLFYVAVTRSKKLLMLSRAKYGRNTGKISQFLKEIKNSYYIVQYRKGNDLYENMKPIVVREEDNILSISFSILTDYFQCQYRFKMSHLYGFKQPIKAMAGYGKIMHGIANDINKTILSGYDMDNIDLSSIIKQNFYLPYLTDDNRLYENLFEKCKKSTNGYFENIRDDEDARIEYVEQPIEVPISKNITLNGRIDLVKKVEKKTNEVKVYITDFKTESIKGDTSLLGKNSRMQLHTYCLGYENLTGKKADYIEIYNLDDGNKDREIVTKEDLDNLKGEIEIATNNIIDNNIDRVCSKEKCEKCFIGKVCLSRREVEEHNIKVFEN
ncbi:UvrD-helicase domain-containing protein [Lutibacter sp. B2]|nr:UvrD-helicase domain-containing protein [Lutibacter sp. B2]